MRVCTGCGGSTGRSGEAPPLPPTDFPSAEELHVVLRTSLVPFCFVQSKPGLEGLLEMAFDGQ